jgi:3'(2'), 5'-bisphosphate nucleotidase
MQDSELLSDMIDAAIDAGRTIQDVYRNTSGGGLAVRSKADSSPVTLADSASEAIILERLARCAPGTPVVAEEEVAAGKAPRAAREFFLVDPLDGTKEFIAGRDEFTVNIALVREGVPVLGVVYAPALGRLYAANASSRAAFRRHLEVEEPRSSGRHERGAASGEPIHVRPVPAQGITAVASRSHSSPETEAYLAGYSVSERISIGSSLKFCLVAEGRADLYPRLGPTMEWDTAAGHAVVLAAGGSVIAPDGQPLRYGKPQYRNPSFIASGPLAPRPLEA